MVREAAGRHQCTQAALLGRRLGRIQGRTSNSLAASLLILGAIFLSLTGLASMQLCPASATSICSQTVFTQQRVE